MSWVFLSSYFATSVSVSNYAHNFLGAIGNDKSEYLACVYKFQGFQLKGIDMVKRWPGPGQKYNLLYSTA